MFGQDIAPVKQTIHKTLQNRSENRAATKFSLQDCSIFPIQVHEYHGSMEYSCPLKVHDSCSI